MGQKSARLGAGGHRRGGAVLTQGLEVECHKLAAHVPEELWHVVGRVHAGALGVDTAELLLVVSEVGSQGPHRALACLLPASRPGLELPSQPSASWPSPCAVS